jgi:hypothetical protein
MMFKLALAALFLSVPLTLLADDVIVNEAEETEVQMIRLAAPLDQDKAEISGLAWCQGKLVLLPQYPERLSDDGISYFYYLEREEIVNYIDGVSTQPLTPKPIRINQKDLRKAVTFFDGFEAIACNDNKLWLSIEALNILGSYQSFVVAGLIDFTQDPSIEIYHQSLVQLKTQSQLRNIGDEAIVLQGDDVIAIHEVNDMRAVEHPKARLVSRKSQDISELAFPNLPYRITDATELDDEQHFWAINYKYSGDKFSRNATDQLAKKFGQGASHKKYYNVERLLEFKIEGESIKLVDRAPIQLKMTEVEGRNWEGIARLKGRGFLIATDKHPATLLGFVPVDK